MLPPKLPEPQTIEAVKDCICFGVDEVNKTLPQKCQTLYIEALQVKGNYQLLLIGIAGMILLFLVAIVLLWIDIKKRKQNG